MQRWWPLQLHVPLQEQVPLQPQVDVAQGAGQHGVLGQHGLWVEQPATNKAVAAAAAARLFLISMDNILVFKNEK